MANIFVADFGNNEGVQTYRVNGGKKDLEMLLQRLREEEVDFIGDPPIIEHVHRSEFTLLLHIKTGS